MPLGLDGSVQPPEFGLYLAGRDPGRMPWPAHWIAWPDFGTPRDRSAAHEAMREAWQRAGRERVEVACSGGRGRTGTALSCLAVLDGITAEEAIRYVRRHYDRRAVETPWQRRFVTRFPAGSPMH